MKWVDIIAVGIGCLIMGLSAFFGGRLRVGIFLLGAGIGIQALIIPLVVFVCQRYFSHPERDEEQPHDQ